jgi:TrmH family RNA methyltransferase
MFSPIPLSSNNLKQIRKLKQKKYRNQYNAFICEGYRLFSAALHSPAIRIQKLIISDKFQNSKQGQSILKKADKNQISVFTTDERHLKSLSDEVTPCGIVFTVGKEYSSHSFPAEIKDDLILYLDRISDPGNLGTIFRSAAWFGITQIILSPGCVDPWNPKTVRASAGAIFNVKLFLEIEFTSLKKQLKEEGFQFVATVLSAGMPISKWKIRPKSIIFLGQEASGLSKDIIKNADVHISIPGGGSVESLNLSVATGILLYEATKLTKNA